MGQRDERIRNIITEHRAKLHVFEPSRRTVWTIVGAEREYWLDPEAGFCSCPAYYFGKTVGRGGCYHLEALGVARRAGGTERILFDDGEYAAFVSGLLADM